MGVATNAAIATLTVSKTLWEKDKLLQWVCHLASSLQLNVQQENSKAPLLQLATQNTILTMRNTILRTLCGMGLHNALDQAPYYLMGGGSASGPLTMGLLMQWMSTADSLRANNQTEETMEAILPELEELLGNKSFVIGSAQASLADFDLALALCMDADLPPLDAAEYPNIARWLETVLWAFAATAPPEIATPEMTLFASNNNNKKTTTTLVTEPIIFYNGTEDVHAVLKPAAKAAVSNKKAAAAGKKNQQQQQEGGKKKGKGGGGGGEQPPQGKKKGGGGGGGDKKNQQPPADAGFTIAAMDIRVGKIVKAWHHENSDKLFCETVDIGDASSPPRQVASGLRQFYQTPDLQDRLVLVVCNLKARPLGGFLSHGMVLCASNADHTAVEFVVPPEGSKPGDRIVFEGFEGEPEPENKVNKKKIFEKVAPDLKTDDQGNVVWKTALAKTEAGGIVRALNGMPNASVS